MPVALVLALCAGLPTVAAAPAAAAQVNAAVIVDGAQIIRSFTSDGVSVNLNFFMDDDSRLQPATPLADSLTQMGAGLLRFPGGEKTDNYLWSVPPYASPDPHFAVTGAQSCAHTYRQDSVAGRYTTDFVKPVESTLDFDEFMDVVAQTGGEAFISVNGDAHHYNGPCDTVGLDRLVETAAEWVRYANVTNNLGVKYWMVGNETWNAAAHDSGSVPSPSEAAADFVAIASAMKAVDPTITIVANSRHGGWISTLVNNPQALPLIDAIGISNYPINGMPGGYAGYRDEAVDLSWPIRRILPTAQAHDLPIIVYEYLPIDFEGSWSSVNDLGHALATMQMLGDQMSFPEVSIASLWNTRWFRQAQVGFDRSTGSETLFDAINPDGSLTPTGQALSLWGNHALDDLVLTTETRYTNVYATLSTDGSDATIFVINRDTAPIDLDVVVENIPGMRATYNLSAESLRGTSQADRFPTIVDTTSEVAISGSTLRATFAPTSITAIKIDGQLTRSLRGSVTTSCISDNGKFAVEVTNVTTSARQVTITVPGLAPRFATVAAGATQTFTITGRRDGNYRVTAASGGLVDVSGRETVRCDPAAPGTDGLVRLDCVGGNGRARIRLANNQSTPSTMTVRFGSLAPRQATVAGFGEELITITGRADDDYPVVIDRNGFVALSAVVRVDCDPNPTQLVTINIDCLAGNGRIAATVGNLTNEAADYAVTIGALSPRVRRISPLTDKTITVTGRADDDYPLIIHRNGLEAYRTTVTVDCDEDPDPVTQTQVLLELSCLQSNGVVKVTAQNAPGDPATFVATIGALAPRTREIDGASQHTFVVTGRPEGPLTIRVDRNDVRIRTSTLFVNCD